MTSYKSAFRDQQIAYLEASLVDDLMLCGRRSGKSYDLAMALLDQYLADQAKAKAADDTEPEEEPS
jgi:hypothetical protein